MKVTIDFLDATHRRAKAQAALNGVSLSEFVSEAIRDKLKEPAASVVKQPGLKRIGKREIPEK